MGKFQVILTVFVLAFVYLNSEATKLNYPRVLLPIFNKISINFTLEVIEKGCFKWMSSRQDLILITPLYEDTENECSSKAVVTVLSRERRRNTAIVLAEDMATGEVLRGDVILDVIDQLSVLTTTRELYLEEAPETFELRAQDSQGNAFTTLEGIEFHWSISSMQQDGSMEKDFLPALRFLTFTESSYHDVPASLEKFEALRIKGYMVLLEGINTGAAKVTVSIPYPEYKDVPINEVFINVLANIILDPSDVHIMAGDTVKFRIFQLKQGKMQEISLNHQYFFQIEDESVASITRSSATGLKLGRTSVVLRDRNVPSEGGFTSDSNAQNSPVPRATLTVSSPTKLAISLLPHNNWVTVEGEKHEIAIDLFTSDDQKITLGPHYSMSSELDETIFYVVKKTKNNSHIYGEAVQEGVSPVVGSFGKLTAKAELQVFKELLLAPSKVILPFDPNAPKVQKIQFRATGGDGSYMWFTQNPTSLQINQNGLATTRIDVDHKMLAETFDERSRAMLTSHAIIKVALTRNTKIFRQAEVFFLPPIKLQIVQYNFETSLKDYVKLHVALYAFVNDSLQPFTKCDNLNFDFEFSTQIFQLDPIQRDAPEQAAPGACHIIYLRSTAIGTTNLRLSYKFMDKLLKDEVTLTVFEKLSILNPIENEIILPIGASRNVIYTNGPQKIFTLEAELTKNKKYDNTVASVSDIEFESQKSMYAFTVMCRKVGQTAFTFDVFNTLASKYFQPYVSNYVTSIYCVKPRFLNLYATEKLRQSCPMEMKSSLMHLKERDDKFEIEIEVQDAKNRKLMNISSLVIDWDFAQGSEKYHKDVSYYRESDEEIVGGVRIPGKDILTTTISDVANNFKIKGTVKRYDSKVLSKHGITAEVPHFGIKKVKTGELVTPIIENEISFMAVNSTLFPMEHISIFLAKNRRQRVPIAQGSGFYEFQLSESGIVSVEYDAKQRELLITPLRIGNVRVELMDRCLMTDPAHLSVSVVSIGSVRVQVSDRVERTKSIEASVKLFDSNDNPLNIDLYNLQIYDLTEDILNPDILSVKLGDQFDLDVGELRYIVTGNNLGETKIVFSSGSGDTMVSSEPLTIQVFPPLRLYPRNSTLIIGSSVQIYYQGGPHPDVNIIYSVHDQKVISMESAIVVARKLGETKITGKCVSVNSGNGKQIVLSEDTIDIRVIPLTSIQIKTPLVRIKSGAVMPASVWGVPDLSPMVLGTLENMRVVWSTNQPDVVDIYSLLADAGIEYSEQDLITVRIKALNPGKAKIQATVILAGGQKIKSTVDVVVFKVLELESPKHITMDWILIAPRSTIQLKANLDDVVYKPDADSSGIVKVSTDGTLRTGDTLGRDLIMAKTYEQTLPIGIEVKNVHYILASLQYPSIKLKQTEEKIPRGMNFVLQISLHDNLGNEFSHNIEDINGIKYDLSHKDMVDVQIGNNLTVAINLPRETSNMIAISLKDTTGVKHAEDYIKLSVAESKHIYPTKTIFSVGDIICFDSPLTLSSFWASSDERIVSIDKFTGIAKVLGNRFKLGEKVVITNGDKAGSFLKYDVEVRDADKIEFFKSFDIFSGTSYRGHLVIRNHLQVDKFANLIAKNISKCSSLVEKIPVKHFTCRLTSKQQQLGALILDHYKVTPIFEAETGTYACQIQLTTSFAEVLNVVKTNDVHFELEAQLPNGLSDIVTLKFVPGIRVSPESLSIDDIKEQEIIVTGLDKVLQKVELKSSDTTVLEVIPQAKSHGSLQYKVKLLSVLPVDEQLFIHVNSPLTLQDIEIPVLGPNALQQKCSNQPFSNSSAFLINIATNVGLIISALIVLGATIWTFLFCYQHRNKTDINSEVFSTSMNNTSNVSNTSGQRSLSHSPSSPQLGLLYPNLSPYYDRGAGGAGSSAGNEWPVYGDPTLRSPQRRIHRRFL